ncbi:ATP-binding protein [Flammeovirga pectinis]|uniref:ATP-binding protein n=1 Tax=Flammeovirga pectinis TaxID=2494373 RepID=A0A3Q9FMA9_9BACT|nr:ATP-binding protein [Flammeovirga pectinis]
MKYIVLDLNFLKQLVQEGEGLKIEFKKKAADPVKIMKEVVAFANNYGGYLIVGVADDGRIDGFTDIEGEKYVLEEAIKTRISKKIDYQIHIVQVSHIRQVVVFEIDPYHNKPVFLLYNLKRKVGKAYIRVADKSVQMSKLIRRILKGRSKDIDYVFQYGELERMVLKLLDENDFITLNQLMKHGDLSEEEASDVLVNLCLSNILKEVPQDLEDRFKINPKSKLDWKF